MRIRFNLKFKDLKPEGFECPYQFGDTPECDICNGDIDNNFRWFGYSDEEEGFDICFDCLQKLEGYTNE